MAVRTEVASAHLIAIITVGFGFSLGLLLGSVPVRRYRETASRLEALL
jgi:hypothetical protein